ncbi:MAG TPA: hypothetical protein VFV33_16140, partial [Gemmatimonadaceae bacterium]|nr:hypothetical protein [Gemmatimonadaceae bacterium]
MRARGARDALPGPSRVPQLAGASSSRLRPPPRPAPRLPDFPIMPNAAFTADLASRIEQLKADKVYKRL